MFAVDRRLMGGLCRQGKPPPDEKRGRAERVEKGRSSWLRF